MALLACDRIHGATILHEQDPACAVHENILYMPVAAREAAPGQQSHGLYDGEGRLIAAAGRFQGPGRVASGPAAYTAQRLPGLPFHAGPFFYLGRFTSHYGHFLVDTLCRLWAWPGRGAAGLKILYHDKSLPERLFALPFAAAIFAALGLRPDDFVRFDEPVRLGQVMVAEPAIEELHCVHRAYARRFNEIGDALCPGPAGPVSDVPVYLTKQNVVSGISHFVNEARFVEVLARAGVRIIAPETLPFAAQVALFRENSIVSGLIGSAFHTSLFTPSCRLLLLNYERTVWSNQILIDRANGNQTEFVYDPATGPSLGAQGGFMNNFEMADPVRLAGDFLRRLDGSAKSPRQAVPAMQASQPPARPHRFALCACARWETGFIVEWLNYYRELGFSHVYFYCNDDDPGPLYERVLPFTQGPAPFVTFRHHPHQGQQYEMYVHFARHGLEEAEWVAFFDIDEYLRLPPGLDIEGFMRRFVPEVECVLFNWVFFGPNGHKTPPDGPVLEHFTRRDARIHPYTKYVAKARAVAEIDFADRSRAHGFWHEFGGKLDRLVMAANVLGEPMIDYYQGFPARPEAFVNEPERHQNLLATAVLHHYAFRSEQAYAERSARGLKGDFNGQAAWKELAEGPGFAGVLAQMNKIEDLSLAGFWAAVRARAAERGTGLPAHVATPTRTDNISRGKKATQSSHCVHSFAPSLDEDAAGGVNGVLDGARKFHTDREENPWWQVDLGGIATITEIHVINTTDNLRGRFRDFALSVSIDGGTWVALLEKRDGAVVEAPVVWAGPGTAWARYVRVTLLGHDFLHLNQVEVFGRLP
jgi:hypothetical protein